MLTLGDLISEVIIQIQQPELTVSVSRPTVKLYVNESLQYVRRFAKIADYLFFTKSASFSGASVNYPAPVANGIGGFESMLLIQVPGSTDGNSRLASNREYNVVNANSIETGTSANPVSRLFSDHFENTPSISGTYYYLATFGNIDDETTDVETLLPWIYVELVVLRAVYLVMLRHFIGASQKTEEASQEIDQERRDFVNLARKWMPDVAFKEEQPSPAFSVSINSNQEGQ